MKSCKKCIVITLISFCFVALTNAQSLKVHELKIGDTVPNITIQSIINYSKESVKISDFRGRLLLLDFWSIWCSGCIAALPKMEKLQQEFGDKIEILPVSFLQNKEKVEAFLKKRVLQGRPINLPTAVYPSMENDLITMFPTQGFPLEVWVDEDGIVRAVTDAFYVTSENIERLLNHENIQLPLSHQQAGFDFTKPFLINNNGGSDTAFLFRSVISPYIDSITDHGFLREKHKAYTRLFYANQSIVDLVKASVYGIEDDFYNKRLVVEIPDSMYLFHPSFDTNYYRNMSKNAFCFELIIPPNFTIKEACKLMRDEINSYFKIDTHIEKRKINCLVLKKSSKDYITSKGSSPNYIESEDHSKVKIVNQPISSLLSFLDKVDLPIILDETGYNERIDIEVQYNPNIAELNKTLNPYGLVLEKAERSVDMLIIKKK